MAIRPCACFLSGSRMGPAQMLHQRIYDADVCLRQSGDADGGGADRSVLFCAAAQRQAQKRLSGTVFCSAWEMVKGFDAGWADFCPAKPCLPSSIYGILNRKNRETAQLWAASLLFDPQIYGSEEAAAIMRCGGCFSAGAPAAGAPDRRRLPARSPTASGVLRPRWGRRAASR